MSNDNSALIAQKAVVLNNKDDVLILRRGIQEWMSRPGGLDLPGGGLEKGEDPKTAIKREIREETGLEITELKPIDVISFNEDQFEVMIIYQALATSDVINLSQEHSDFYWMNKEEIIKSDLPKLYKNFIVTAEIPTRRQPRDEGSSA